MSKDDYLSEKEAAEILHVKPSTLMKNRSLGKNHPPYVKFGAKVLYPKKLFQEWLKSLGLHTEIKAG